MINLETIMVEEIKLWSLFNGLKTAKDRGIIRGWLNQEMMTVCEEWWSITKDPAALFDLYKIYTDS
jgi:hypothetical protein